MTHQRIKWIDVLKLLGIMAIFCGHLGNDTGGLHDFVFKYHVPLFFFAAGIFADHLEELRMKHAVIKKLRQLMLPYLFFVILSMGIIILTTDEDIYKYMAYGKQFVFGIRNQMYASSLWFFSCLFCMCILFDALRRVLKSPALLVVVSAAFYFVTIFLLPNKPNVTPSWVFNIDSAMHYLIYYAIGYLFRKKLTVEDKKLSGKIRTVRLTVAAFLIGYALLVYLNKDVAGQYLCGIISGIKYVYPVIRALLLIGSQIVLAKLLAEIGCLHNLGAQTMWFCGNEFVVKKIFTALMDIIGFQIRMKSALSAVIYAAIMIYFIYKWLLPCEKKIYYKLLECFGIQEKKLFT